jgi:hypothetical protein
MKNTNYTKITRLATSPMNLDSGKPQAHEVLFSSALTLLFILLSAIGAWVASLFGPRQMESLFPGDYTFIGIYRLIGVLFGISVSGFCILNAVTYSSLTRKGWISYHNRLQDWHDVTIEAYLETKGKEEMVNVNIFEVNPRVPADVLAIALCVHQKLKQGTEFRTLPYSVRGLEGSHFLTSSRGNMILVGIVEGTKPEELKALFVQLGLIVGASPRSAGNWVPRSEAEVIDCIVSGWGKLPAQYQVDWSFEDEC